MKQISKTYYTIGSLAKLTSTTVRTLDFYDHKGLLKPSGRNEQGHRTYNDEDLFRLQQILALKYLDLSLDEIGKFLEQGGKDFKTSLEVQYELLLKKQEHTQRIIATIERVKAIVKDNDTIDPQLIILMIHAIQQEGELKQWLFDRLPDEFVESMFVSGANLEHEIMIVFNNLLAMSKQGLQPEHPLVQERGLVLKLILNRLLEQPLEALGKSETGKILMGMEFPSNFQPDFINYLLEVFRHLMIHSKEGEGE
ncbi:MerR family transcriptional regulator [Paenibacillus pinihumi]|uniref:MerR family transcriptional regulator n=1 Tax=Paenibacillus pinihumi TaxID=669462 RepID=UPI00048C373B|nr:MerR family transcriptional regulator [Paenibacillus pinihumi]